MLLGSRDFSKIFEKVIKNQLVSDLGKYFSPFTSENRKCYRTQQVLTRLLEEWRQRLHKNFAVDEVLVELFKAFNLNLIIGKLSEYESERESLRLI